MNLDQEKILIQKAQKGDRQAVSELWDAITPKLFGYLINTVKNKTLAEDLLQATWLKAITGLPSYEFRGISLSAWIFAIARNELLQHWRKSKNEVEQNDDSAEPIVIESEHSNNKIFVEQILSKLSNEDREIIRLRYIADLSPNEIAKILNINFVAVRVRLHRALARARIVINS